MEKINNPKMVSQLMDLREQFMSEKRALTESNYPPTPFPKGLDETMAEAARLINVCMRLGTVNELLERLEPLPPQ